MSDLAEGGWQTPEERAFMRALDAEIARLTRLVVALREAYGCDEASRAGSTAKIINLSTERSRRTSSGSM